jgi:hypothetical protein
MKRGLAQPTHASERAMHDNALSRRMVAKRGRAHIITNIDSEDNKLRCLYASFVKGGGLDMRFETFNVCARTHPAHQCQTLFVS